MKRLICFLLCVLSLGIFGCAPQGDGFVEVCSVTYVNDSGSSVTVYSEYSIIPNSDKKIEITSSEYSLFDGPKSDMLPIKIDSDKSNLFSISEEDEVCYYNYFDFLLGLSDYTYYKSEIERIVINYVYVKIVNTNIIEIKNNNGQLTISTTYYSIRHFN